MVFQVSSGSLWEEEIIETESAREALQLARKAYEGGKGYMVITLIEGGDAALSMLDVLAQAEMDTDQTGD